MKRKGTKEITHAIIEWVDATRSNRKDLLKVVLVNSTEDLSPMVGTGYFMETFQTSSATYHKYKSLLNPILDAMHQEGIIIDGHSGTACEWRRRLLFWYEGLSVEEKKNIPIFGNSISKRRCLDKIQSLRGIKIAVHEHFLAKITLTEIHDDLRNLGVLDKNYKSVKARIAEKPKPINAESQKDKFKRLRKISVSTVNDILPPCKDDPFLSLQHIYACASIKSNSESGISNYIDAFGWMSEFLSKTGYKGTETLDNILGSYLLVKFRKFIEQKIIEGKISPSHANTLISSSRSTLSRACDIDNLGFVSFVDSPGFEASRVTDIYKPYSKDERNRIALAIDSDIEHHNKLATPYSPSDKGSNPLDENFRLKKGYGTLTNARWIFDNKLNKTIISFGNQNPEDPYQKAFLSIISSSGVGIQEVYESWGVQYKIDSETLAPYVAKLAQVTGLNADSLKTLDLDDYIDNHPATGRPCLYYWKERSNGAKEYHLDIFKAEITWLTTSQSKEIKKIFSDIKNLTKGIRELASDEIKNRLFIYRSSSARTFFEIKSLASSSENVINKLFDKYAKVSGILGDDGKQLSLSASRFRPSFVSELVEKGVSIREIQLMLGHGSIKTTLSYLDRMDFNKIAREKINTKLIEIHGSTIREPQKLGGGSTPEPSKNSPDSGEIFFKTPLAGCKNIFDPPDFIKKISSYTPGRPCSIYNRCLSCDNVIITISNLPELFAMQRDYLILTESSRVMDTP